MSDLPSMSNTSFLTVADASDVTGVGQRRIYRMVRSGRVEAVRDVTGRLLVEPQAVLAAAAAPATRLTTPTPATGSTPHGDIDWPTFRDGITPALVRLLRMNAQLQDRVHALEDLLGVDAGAGSDGPDMSPGNGLQSSTAAETNAPYPPGR